MSNTFGSLFAGVGGFDLGMESAGWDCQWQVEWDKKCQSVLRKHWPDVPKYFDIRDVDGSTLTPVDCIVFGSPCQDLSIAGKGGGLEGSRSGLFHEAIRIIKEMRNATRNEFPKWTIWENVPGALSSNKGNDFAKVIDEMANIGALAIEWHILDAQWYGVAQRRRRVYMLACYDPGTVARCPQEILPVPEDRKGHIKQGRKKRKQAARTAEAILGKPSVYGKIGHGKWAEGGISLSATDYKRPEANIVAEPYPSTEPFVKVRRAQSKDDFETWAEGDVSPTLNTFDNGGESRATVLIVDTPISFHAKQVSISSENVSQTLYGQNGIAVGVPVPATDDNVTVFQPGTMVRQGSGVSENIVPTLRAEHHNGDNFPHIAYQHPIIVDGTRVNDIRIYEDQITPTLKHRMGTGGGQVPLVGLEQPVLAYDGYNNKISEDIYRTLRIGIDSADHIAIPIQGTIIGRSDSAGPQGKGFGDENDPSYTLDTISQHGVMTSELILRKLTPLECERLMGFPDNHTKYDDEGKIIADTNRYKMCGNAVASPVAKWIGEIIKNV